MTTPTQAPARSLLQRMEALERANDVRQYRARLKERLRAGVADPVEVLRAPAPELATMKVSDLLLATPKWGRGKVNKTLGECRISPSKHLGGLSERQRRELATIVARRVGARPVERPPVTHPTTLM